MAPRGAVLSRTNLSSRPAQGARACPQLLSEYAGASARSHHMPGLDERQHRPAVARWLLLPLRLRACPRHWRRCPAAQEDCHVSTRKVPAFVPARVFVADTSGTRSARKGHPAVLEHPHAAPLVIAALSAADVVADRPTAPSAPRLLSA
jgi:hypothetical protein